MASMKRIEALATRLNHKEPAWIRGYEKRDNHLSGALREAEALLWGDRTGVAHEVLTEDELTLSGLLEEAAESLDDAHEEWLNLTLAGRDLVGDVEAMKADGPDPDMEGSIGWFGPFSKWEADDQIVCASIEWPNLEISQEVLCQVLAGKLEYEL